MTCNDNAELLRVNVLSLEGVQLLNDGSCSNDGSDSGGMLPIDKNDAAKGNQKIITAWAGFRSTSLPPKSMAVSSSQYSTMFANVNINEGNLLAVCSEEVVWNREDGGGGVFSSLGLVHWHDNILGDGEKRETQINSAPMSNNSHSQCSPDQHRRAAIPHLEINLPAVSSSLPLPQAPKEVRRSSLEPIPSYHVIEFHICVVCTNSLVDDQNSAIGDDLDENDDGDDSIVGMEGNVLRDDRPHMCYGVAHLKLSRSEADGSLSLLGNNEDGSTILSSFSKGSGRVMTLPIQRIKASSPNSEQISLSQNATLSIQVERVSVPVQHSSQTGQQQRHYIESRWRVGDGVAPASIIHNDSTIARAGEGECSAGLTNLLRRATSTLTLAKLMEKPALPAATVQKNERRSDPVIGRIIQTVVSECPPSTRDGPNSSANIPEEREMAPTPHHLSAKQSMALKSNSHLKGSTYNNKTTRSQRNNGTSDNLSSKHQASKTSSKQKQLQQQSSNKPMSQTLSERFLCGANVSFSDFGDALKMAAAAGHHCDEDHVGLYVVDTEDSMTSSIATADVMGF